MSTRGSFPEVKQPGMKLTTHLNLVPRSKMHGAISPLPQYAFMAWCSVKSIGTTLMLNIGIKYNLKMNFNQKNFIL
jgi:hypothetical protein